MACGYDIGDEFGATKPIHFFRLIVAKSSRNELRIPGQFVKKYGQVLSDKVFLKLPNGAEWKVNLEKRNDGVWFQKGWKEFAEYHSLFEGRLLVFRYDRISHFQVLIMDTSCVEIDYPSNGKDGKEASNDQGFHVPQTEIFQERTSYRKRKNSLPLPSLQKRKMTRVTKEGHKVESISYSKETDLHHTSIGCKGVSQGKSNSKFLKLNVVNGLQHPKTPRFGEVNRALERANAFKSQYPSFVFVARQSYLYSSPDMNLPSKFAKRFLGSKKNGESANLHMLDGRVWLAKYIIRKYKTRTRFELSCGGWKAFARDNDLKVGDVCVFELTGRTEITFQVLIFRNTEESGQSRVASQGQRERRVEVKTEINCSGNDAFGITDLHGQPITKKFQPKLEPSKYLQTELPGRLLDRDSRGSCFCWYEIGELKQWSQGRRTDNQNMKRTSFRDFGTYGCATAASFNSQNPFFRVTIGLSHTPRVPDFFVKKYFKHGGQVVLEVGGRLWRVKLILHPRPFFSAGWGAFARENALEVGDACLFELMNSDEIVMKVSIFKNSSAK